ncbi:unnamed protein product [Calypogeia fissa]
MSVGRHSKFTYYSVLLLHRRVCHSPLPLAAAAAIGGASLRTAMRFEERTLVHQVCARRRRASMFEIVATTMFEIEDGAPLPTSYELGGHANSTLVSVRIQVNFYNHATERFDARQEPTM